MARKLRFITLSVNERWTNLPSSEWNRVGRVSSLREALIRLMPSEAFRTGHYKYYNLTYRGSKRTYDCLTLVNKYGAKELYKAGKAYMAAKTTRERNLIARDKYQRDLFQEDDHRERMKNYMRKRRKYEKYVADLAELGVDLPDWKNRKTDTPWILGSKLRKKRTRR